MLDAVVDFLPSPLDVEAIKELNIKMRGVNCEKVQMTNHFQL